MNAVRFEQNDNVGHIVLMAPPFNFVGIEYLEGLSAALHEASSSDIRVVLIRSEAENFSMGGEVTAWPGKTAGWFNTFVKEVTSCYRTLEALPVPTVAAVRGLAAGGGYELALACDLIVASEGATFWHPETLCGQTPLAGGVQRLASIVGPKKATWLVTQAIVLGATEAHQLGIVSQVVPDIEFDTFAQDLAQDLAKGPTRAYAATRALLKAWSSGGIAGADAMQADLVAHLFSTSDSAWAIEQVADALKHGQPVPKLEFQGK